MNDLRIKIQWLKNMIELHTKLDNKGMKHIFEMKLNKLESKI